MTFSLITILALCSYALNCIVFFYYCDGGYDVDGEHGTWFDYYDSMDYYDFQFCHELIWIVTCYYLNLMNCTHIDYVHHGHGEYVVNCYDDCCIDCCMDVD